MEKQNHFLKLKMHDGYLLALNVFEPINSPKAVVLIGSALGVGQYYYFGIARFLSDKGFAVVTHDYRGISKSAPKKLHRKFDAGFVQLGKDFGQIMDWAAENFSEIPMVLLGHSLGGIVPMFSKNIAKCKAVFMVGSQTVYFKDFGNSKSQFVFTALMWHGLVPLLSSIFGYFPGHTLGLRIENIPFKLIRDIQQRRKHTEAVDFLKKLGVDSQHLSLSCPMFSLTFSDDPICTTLAMHRLLRDFKNATIENQVINADVHGKVGHTGFFRKKHQETLWPKVSNWFENILLTQSEYSHQILKEFI